MSLKSLFLSAAIALLTAVNGPVAAETLTLGSVNDNIKKHLKRFQPLAEALEKELAGDGITGVKIRVLPNSDAMARALQDGEVDLYFDSPLVAARVARASGAVPFLRRWKDGVASYHSVIFVRSDSGIETLDDLLGSRIGFQEPDSTSGFMLPAGLLRSAGLEIRELNNRSEAPRANEVGYVFTGDDNNTLAWIYKGWIEAAATDPHSFGQISNAAPNDFKVVARSVEVPRQTVVHSSNLRSELVDRIRAVLTEMDETEEGREVLLRFNDTTRFDDFPDGIDATFNPIYGILDQLIDQGIM